MLFRSVAISLENRNADSGSKTTQFSVNPTDVVLTTDFQGAQNEWTFGNDGSLTLPGIEDDTTAVVDFFASATNNHKFTLASDWALKLKARADGGNEGHLYLQAGGAGTRVQINGNESNVQICASDGSENIAWFEFDKFGTLHLPSTIGDIKRDGEIGRTHV